MKTTITLLCFLAMFYACKKETKPSTLTTITGESGMSYRESLDNWAILKQRNGNSYVYQTRVQSWAGWVATTEIRVENDVVTSRIYEEFELDAETGNKAIIAAYKETGTDIGRHNRGALPLTIDGVYTTCARDYLIASAESNSLRFNTDPRGLMTLCGYIPHGCLDDCFHGISISAFDWLDGN